MICFGLCFWGRRLDQIKALRASKVSQSGKKRAQNERMEPQMEAEMRQKSMEISHEIK